VSRDTERREPLFGVKLGALRDVPLRDMGVRFAFGAGISATAGVVALLYGPRVGGVFLAFPAILPATLTLIEKEESKAAAEDDDVGSILGAVALVLFAGLAWFFFPRLGAPEALAVAGAAWLACALLLYLLLRLPFRS
jgi:uncharacterized membrane protein (GlpM family)